MQLSPYLMFDGTCEAAFKFYERCLGAKLEAMMTYGGSPMEAQFPAEWRAKIMHACLIKDGQMLMGSDSMPQGHEAPQGISVSIGISDPAEAERIFHDLAAGGTVKMPIQETFWAARFGMLVDRFGIPWMINCDKPI